MRSSLIWLIIFFAFTDLNLVGQNLYPTTVGSQVHLPGIYNFEQVNLGQYSQGASGLEMISHIDAISSYGTRIFSYAANGIAGIRLQTASPTSSAQNLNYITRLAINTDGNIGIGTIVPSSLLEVYTNLPSTGSYNTQSWTTLNPNYGLKLQTVWDTHGINQQFIQKFNGVDYSSLSFYQGNIGIGTASPSSLLEVYTNLPSAGSYNTQSWTTLNPNYGLNLKTIWNNHGINQQFIQKYNGVDYNTLSFSQGNVGIGTDLSRALDNKLEVNGTIRCKEVLVEATPWPDYVFAKDYKLKSINEVDTYIKANNHLPDMPAASEIEQNGVKLSELNTKLLQKVEELTLYIIQLKKEVDEMKKKGESDMGNQISK